MLQHFFLWVLLALSLPSQSSQACYKGKEAECQNADFAPGSDLAGEGFDITTMQRKGAFVIDMSLWKQSNNSCTLCKNPFMKDKQQKLPLAVVDWRASRKCRSRVSSSVYESSESLLTSSTSSIENNWKVNLGIETIRNQASMALAGTNSKLADYSMAKTKKDKYSFTSHGVTCGYYSYRLSSRPHVHPELSSEFARLPETYNKRTMKRFYQLIDKFGTHYITKVSLGGAVHSVTSIKQCQASMQGVSVDEVKTCLDVEASASVMGTVNFNTEYHHCKDVKDKSLNRKSFSSSFSDRFTDVTGGHSETSELLFSQNTDPQAYKDWLSSLPQHPDVLTYSLESLHELVPQNQSTHEQLRLAIRDYILQRGLWKNCSSQCQVGIKTNSKESCVCSCHNVHGMGSDCCPKQRGLAQITVTVEKATGLWGDYFTETDAYVNAYRNGKTFVSETAVIWNNNNPIWNHQFNFDVDDLTVFKSLVLKVWDRDNKWDDDLLGVCNIQLKAGTKSDICSLNHGLLYYKVIVTCIPSLTGPTCSDYVSTPMSPQLEKIYVSRHARPIPREMLTEIGVLLSEDKGFSYQNLAKKDEDTKL